MRPGLYLQKRRQTAGLQVGEVARQLAVMQFGFNPINRAVTLAHMAAVEMSERHLSLPQAEVLRNVFAFDVSVYDQLVDRDLADEITRRSLPHPQICRDCACSYFDPCEKPGAHPFADATVCGWAEEDLCTHCARADNSNGIVRPSAVSICRQETGALVVTPILEREDA